MLAFSVMVLILLLMDWFGWWLLAELWWWIFLCSIWRVWGACAGSWVEAAKGTLQGAIRLYGEFGFDGEEGSAELDVVERLGVWLGWG